MLDQDRPTAAWLPYECAVPDCPDPVDGVLIGEQAVRISGEEVIRYRMHVFTCAGHHEPIETALRGVAQPLGPQP